MIEKHSKRVTWASCLFLFLFTWACGKGAEEDPSLKMEEAFVHYELGMDYLAIGETEKAVKEWEEAIRLNPESEAHHMLGHVFFQKGDLEAARKEWEFILSKDPGNFMALNNLGNLYQQQKNEEKALEHYTKALQANPKMALAHYNVGNIYFSREEFKQAKEAFEKAINLDPQMSAAVFQLGNTLVQEKKYNEAIPYFVQMTEGRTRKDQGFDPFFAGFSSLGSLYLTQGNLVESEKNLKKGLEIKPSDPILHYSLGNVYENQEKMQEAETEYKKALKLAPDFAYAYNGLGNLYAEMGKNLDEAEDVLQKGMAKDPSLNEHFLDSLGWVYYKQGKLDKAITNIKEAIKLTSSEKKESLSNKHYHLGMILKAQGKAKEADENFKKAEELYPERKNAGKVM